jgi:ATP-binding cassette subfamily F protein uup
VRLIQDRPSAEVRSIAIEAEGQTPRLGDKVIECTGVGFRYGEGPMVLSGVDLMLGRRERLGIVGANGTGKSTLLDLLAGRRRPTIGRVDVGPTVVAGYYDQRGSTLDLQARVQDLVAGPHHSSTSVADVELMKRFLFSGELPFAPVGTLSGGERRRLQLLLVLARRPNVLLLDEPTNDLDLDTLRILEDFLEEWPGALVVVSHDRTFLDRTTERLAAVGADGAVSVVPGGVTGWVARLEHGDLPRAGSLPSALPVRGRPRAPGVPSPGTGGHAVPLGRLLREAEKNWVRLVGERDRIMQSLTIAADYVEMTRLGSELAETQAELEKAEEVWLALAEEAESRN